MTNSFAEQSVMAFQTALTTLAGGLASFVPRLIVALFAFIVLWIVAVMLGKLVEQIMKALKIDSLLEGVGMEEPLSRAGYKLNTGAFFGGLVRWFFMVLALLVAVDILQLTAVSQFLGDVVLGYLPNVIVAAVIVVAAAVLADAAQKIVRGTAQAADMPGAHFIGAVAKWSIWTFAILAALYQLGIVGPLIQTIVTAFVAMLALAGGLAFGLGGKEHASQFIEKMKKDMR